MIINRLSERPYLLSIKNGEIVFSSKPKKMCLSCKEVLLNKKLTAQFCSDSCRASHWNLIKKQQRPKLYLVK